MERVDLHDGRVTLYHGNNADLRDELAAGLFDAVVSDPPYGIGYVHSGHDGKGIGKGKYSTKLKNLPIVGDDKPFDPRPLLDLAPLAILWGGNH